MASPSEGKASLEELRAEVAAAQSLLDGETADAIIGEQTDEYRALIRGVRAMMAMQWAAYKSSGLRQTPASLRYGGQTMVVILDLVHKAYALGLRRGREEQRQGEESDGTE